MRSFPDENTMPRSQDGSEPIRGGSIGFNRILSFFVNQASKDRKPQFNAFVISAFTIFRNVWNMQTSPTAQSLDEAFVKDINLFLDYYDTYLSFTLSSFGSKNKAPVVVYFPTYKHVPKDIRKEHTGKQLNMITDYEKFYQRHSGDEGTVRKLDLVTCYWIRAGDGTYPHKEVARKFRDISSHVDSFYHVGDPVGLISHVALDWYMNTRIRNLSLMESYTSVIKKPGDFRFKLDKEGRVPFLPAAHVALGDDTLIKPMVTHKLRKDLLLMAAKDRWTTRSEDDVGNRISKSLGLASSVFKKYDFI